MVRTRFAPSPTGALHIGGVRTALFSFLLARSLGGQFFLRIEDTDRARFKPGTIQQIMDSLRWTGIDFDAGPDHASLSKLGEDFLGALPDAANHGIPGPFVQSERLHLYREHAEKLVAQGVAYRCNETPEELQRMRLEAEAAKRTFTFKKANRLRADVQPGDPGHHIRLDMPITGQAVLDDLVMGRVTFEYANVDDPVIVKGDGSATYHLAAMYDDWAMGVTHIIRSTEWLASVPKHLYLFHVSGWPMPKFGHVPNVNGEDGKKLSKRKGAPSMFEFRDAGYLPEAAMNYLALLGWAPGGGDEQNVFTSAELFAKFSMAHVGSSPAIFSYPKLDWLNGTHIRRLAPDDLAGRLMPFLKKAGITVETPEQKAMLARVIPLVQERLKRLNEIGPLVDFAFVKTIPPVPRELLIGPKMEQHLSLFALKAARDVLGTQQFDDDAGLEKTMRDLCDELKLKPNQLFTIIRNAISGKTVTPPLFGLMGVIGKDVCLARIDAAVQTLSA